MSLAVRALEQNIVRFAHLLRQLGVRVSTAEVIDALRALELIPLEDKSIVKASLRAAMVKDRDGERLFDHAFESFFAPPEEKKRREQALVEGEARRLSKIREAERDLQYLGRPLELTPEEKIFYTKLSEYSKERIRDFLRKSCLDKKAEARLQPFIENMVRGHLNYWRRHSTLEEGLAEGDIASTGDPEMDALLRDVGLALSREEVALLYKDIESMADDDLPKAAAVIRKLSRVLATRISRRYRQSARIASIDLRRTIRHNVGYGGTLIKLKYKTRKVNRPQIVLICDVSGSMARYAVFVMQFMYGLADVAKKIETFIFGEDLEQVTSFFKSGRSFQKTMDEIVEASRVWGGGTNLNTALGTFERNYINILTSHTVILIVSDTKTLYAELAAERLRRISRRAKKVLWLNTLPRKEWPRFRAVDVFAREVPMYECNTIGHLEKIVRHHFL